MTAPFKVALRLLPRAAELSFDQFAQTTVADLCWIVQHEIDLYNEGQDGCDIRTARDLAACRRFLARFGEGGTR